MNKNGLIYGEEYKPMPPIGSLRIGEKYIAQSGNESVRSIDYFRATGDYARFFHNIYGEKPNRIKIIFPSSDARLSCCNYYEIRKGSMLYAVGDGVFFMYANKDGKLEEKIIKEDFETSQFKRESEDICTTQKLKAEWKKRLRLRFFIEGIQGITGYWELITGAEATSIHNIINSFHTTKAITGGRIHGLKFELSVKMHTGNMAFSKKKYPVLTLICLHDIEMLQAISLAQIEGRGLPFIISDKKPITIENKTNIIEDNDLDSDNDFQIIKNIIEKSTPDNIDINVKIIKEKSEMLTESQLVALRKIYLEHKKKLNIKNE